MEIAKSHIIKSDAGRDMGKLFVVLDTQGEYLLLADGKSRKVEAPKRKKAKHVVFIAQDTTRLAEKIQHAERVSNSEIRKTLAVYGKEVQLDQEG